MGIHLRRDGGLISERIQIKELDRQSPIQLLLQL